MSKRGVLIAVAAALAVLAVAGYWYRLELLLFAAPRLQALADPIQPNRPVAWSRGPAEASAPAGERPPNIVLILADDLGVNDISLAGGANATLQTPHIDSIATGGVAFESGYAGQAVCSPSRAALMTGRYSTRFGVEFTPFPRIGATIFDWLPEDAPPALRTRVFRERAAKLAPMPELGMPPAEVTIAEALKPAGYQTAHIGKWHLGSVGAMRPERQGFDDSLHMASGFYLPEDSPAVVNARLPYSAIDRMVWSSMRYAAIFNGGPMFAPGGYLTDYYTDEAVRVIEANRNRPFFLYLAHWAPHTPLQASREDYAALAGIDDHVLRVYAAMIRSLDRGVGRVLAALRANGLEHDTLVIFTSDNGGARYLGLPDVNRPYRGWKLTLFEGGIRVPFLAQWPARIPPGTRFEAPVSHLDIFATAAAAAGAPLPADRVIDGVDLLPFVAGEQAGPPHETLFWREGSHQAVRHRGWKLIVSATATDDDGDRQRWLFDLGEDPTEQRNLAPQEPVRVQALQALLDAHNAEQAPPLWPSVVSAPQLIDKTEAEAYAPGDEFVIWPN